MINKVLAAAITVAFMAVVRPDPDVSKIGIVFAGIIMYEGLEWSIKYIRKARKKSRYIKSATISRQDMKVWADTWLYHPLSEEVS